MPRPPAFHRLRRKWLLGTTAIGLAFVLGVSLPAHAADECGPIANGEVTCTSAGNNYTSGITYNPADDLTIVVDEDVRIFPDAGHDGINISNAGGNLFIGMYGGIVTQGAFDDGIRIYQANGLVTVSNLGTIIIGGDHSHGISIVGANGASIEALYGIVATHGAYAHSIYVSGTNGSVDIIHHTYISTAGQGSHGVAVYGTIGNVNVSVSGSAGILTQDEGSSGIVIDSVFGNVNVTTDGEIETEGDSSTGIEIRYRHWQGKRHLFWRYYNRS